jgi:hypothetical protein
MTEQAPDQDARVMTSECSRLSSRATRHFVALVAALFVHGSAAAALQVDIGPQRGTKWGPRLDSVAAGLATRAVWHGFDLGSPALHAVADIGIWGRSVTAAGDWSVSLLASALIVPDPRASGPTGAFTGGRIAGGPVLARRLGREGAALDLRIEAYHLPQDDVDSNGIESGLRLSGVQIPWPLGETRPALDAAVRFDRGRFDGKQAEAGVTLPLIANIFRLASFVSGRVRANDYRDGSFNFDSWEATLGWNLDLGGGPDFRSPFAGPWKITMTGSLLKPRASAVAGWIQAGFAFIH